VRADGGPRIDGPLKNYAGLISTAKAACLSGWENLRE